MKGKGKGKSWVKEPWTREGPNGEAATDLTCWDFKMTGTCKRGDRCKWIH